MNKAWETKTKDYGYIKGETVKKCAKEYPVKSFTTFA